MQGDGIDETGIRRVLEQHGATDVSVERTEPSLEDVFLAVTSAPRST